MKRVLFLQNGDGEGPGLFAPALAANGVELAIVHAWRSELVPNTPDGFDGIAIGGGTMSAYDTAEFPFLEDEMALVRAARDSGCPVLGFCLGAQLMAGALGGRVFANATKEIGFHEVTFTPAAAHDPLWHDHPAPFHPVHWHSDTFTLPPGAELLASSALTPHQLFRVEAALYGFQFHLEIDLPSLREMVASEDARLRALGVDPGAFVREGAAHLPSLEAVARRVFTKWAAL